MSKTAGRYQLLEELGRGAMGVVFKAHDPTIGRTVAVKTMRLAEAHTGLSHDELISRFGVETRAAGLLTHPNIVVVYDAGEDSGVFYITMEYVQGRSLQAMMDEKQVFPLPRVTKIMEQAGSALDFAHLNNVVHRDIKPANLMMTGDDVVKVTDFGTAKILQKGATQTGAILGTPSYMSPEQVKGKPVDGRSDIFSLGVILYELVTGEKPFPGQNVTTVIYKIVNEDPIPACELDESIHAGLNYVITKALHKDPEQRYQNCKELVADLRNYKQLGFGPMDSATVIQPGRRPKAVDEEIARLRALKDSATVMVTRPEPEPEPLPVAPRPLPRPVTLPPLTGSLPRPTEEQPKKSYASVWISLLLLVVVGVGGYFIYPPLKVFIGSQSQKQETASPESTAPSGKPAEVPPAAAAKAPEPEPAATDPAGVKLQSQIEQRLADAGLSKKINVRVSGKNVTLSGLLTEDEHRKLRSRIARIAPQAKIADQIQIAKAGSAPPAAAAKVEDDTKPRTSPGRGEIEVLTGDVLGASVKLISPKGETQTARTPFRFEELPPGRYQLEIAKEGYRTERRISNVSAGHVVKEDVKMQAVQGGLIVNSSPGNAKIYINGTQREERTPATIRLAPGNYRVEVEMEGYENMQQAVQVQGEDLKQLTFPMTRMTSGRPRPGATAPAPAAQVPVPAPAQQPQRAAGSGFVDIKSVPPGADILVNGANSGRKTPSKMELPAGSYRLTIFLRGYAAVQRVVQVEEGKTLPLNESLVKQ